MTKKYLLQRIEMLEEKIGERGCYGALFGQSPTGVHKYIIELEKYLEISWVKESKEGYKKIGKKK